MIPAKLLTIVAEKLTAKTRQGDLMWNRKAHDTEIFSTVIGSAHIHLRYQEMRIEPDIIDLVVSSSKDELIGQLKVREDDKESYEILADLLFVIQRAEGRGPLTTVTNDLLNLLTPAEQHRWKV
jgi:hypothetical protein